LPPLVFFTFVYFFPFLPFRIVTLKMISSFFRFALLFLALLVSSCSSGASVEGKVDPEKSNEHYLLGIEFAQYSLFQNSLDEFDLAIKYNPDDWKSYNKKGLIYFGIKNYPQAKQMFQKANALNSKNPQLLVNLGMVDYMEGNKDGALSYWENSISLSPSDNDGKPLNNIGNLYKEKGEIKKAIEYYEKAVSQEKSYLYINNLAEAYRTSGEVDKAEKILLDSIKENPKSQLAHFNLAKVYSGQDKLDQALKAFAKSLEVNPQFLEPYFESAQIYLKRNDKDSAVAQLKKAIEEGAAEPKFKELLNKITA
jgi:tetratricopeptide (TPR) repeat protein